jgi:hypothetical protein
LIADPKLKLSVLSEKADGEVTYQSVFDPAKVTKSTGPRLPEGPPLKEPVLEKGKEYLVAPVNNQRAVPRFSRRALLGPTLARADNVAFKRNIANRLWALMMGRGLGHPLDLDHAANPPSHPELLKLLADDLAARKFDMRGFLRKLALSQTYQRSSEPVGPASRRSAGEPVGPASRRSAGEPVGPASRRSTGEPLMPEQLAWSLMQAIGGEGALLACAGITEVSNAFAGIGNPLIALFDWKSGKTKQLLRPKTPFQGTAWGVVVPPTGFIVGVGGGNGGMLWFWKPDSPQDFFSLKLPNNARDLALHPDGRRLAVPFFDGAVRTYVMEAPAAAPASPPKPKKG